MTMRFWIWRSYGKRGSRAVAEVVEKFKGWDYEGPPEFEVRTAERYKNDLTPKETAAVVAALNAEPRTREVGALTLTKSAGGWTPVRYMTDDECEGEVEWLGSYFSACAESGNGISSKETVRMRECVRRCLETKRYVSPEWLRYA